MSLRKFSSSSIVLIVAGMGVILARLDLSYALLRRFIAATVLIIISPGLRKTQFIGALVLVGWLNHGFSRAERNFKERFGKRDFNIIE